MKRKNYSKQVAKIKEEKPHNFGKSRTAKSYLRKV